MELAGWPCTLDTPCCSAGWCRGAPPPSRTAWLQPRRPAAAFGGRRRRAGGRVTAEAGSNGVNGFHRQQPAPAIIDHLQQDIAGPAEQPGVWTKFVAETLLPTKQGKFRLRGYRHTVRCCFDHPCRRRMQPVSRVCAAWAGACRQQPRPARAAATARPSHPAAPVHRFRCLYRTCRAACTSPTCPALPSAQQAGGWRAHLHRAVCHHRRPARGPGRRAGAGTRRLLHIRGAPQALLGGDHAAPYGRHIQQRSARCIGRSSRATCRPVILPRRRAAACRPVILPRRRTATSAGSCRRRCTLPLACPPPLPPALPDPPRPRAAAAAGAGLAQVRLPGAAGAGHGLHPGPPARHGGVPAAGGARHRAGQQDRGLRAAGEGPGHGGRQPRAGPARRLPRVQRGAQLGAAGVGWWWCWWW